MMEEHAVLSERLEDQLKAVEWAREQKKKITDDKNRRIADALMEKIVPFALIKAWSGFMAKPSLINLTF